jgi:FKBP-type peptidyl-prolyl cis-trans isomerase SlyD
MKIDKNKVVQIHYTLRNDQGEILDSSAGHSPLSYIHGIGALIPGLEKELDGKEAGVKFETVISPADGYGEYDPAGVIDVPASGFEGDEELTPGMQVQLETGEGPAIAVITKVDDDVVTLDLNHPLAGVSLHFDVEVVEVREATHQELDHGHVHGTGGHHH